MAYSAPSTISTGDLITAAKWNADVSANPIAIYAGAMSVTSQAVGDILYASSTTQLGRVGIGSANKVLTSSGSAPQWSTQFVNAALPTNVDLGGTLDVTGATTLDSTLAVSSTAATAIDVAGGITAGTGNVALVGTDGKINGPLSSTIIDDLSAANLTSIPGGQITGAIAAVSGANLTTLNASNISSGTLANARLPTNVDLGGTLDVTGATTLDSTLAVVGAATFNDAGADVDFRIETDGDTHALMINGGTNNVGIGEADPGHKFTVSGTGGAQGSMAAFDTSAERIANLQSGGSADADRRGNLQIWGTNAGAVDSIALGSTGSASCDLLFATRASGGTAAVNMCLHHDGKVGIGTVAPQADLHIDNASAAGVLISRINTGVSFTDGYDLGYLRFGGQDADSTYDGDAAQIIGQASGAWTSSSHPTEILFTITAASSTSATERMRIDEAGVTITGAIAGATNLGKVKYFAVATLAGDGGASSTATDYTSSGATITVPSADVANCTKLIIMFNGSKRVDRYTSGGHAHADFRVQRTAPSAVDYKRHTIGSAASSPGEEYLTNQITIFDESLGVGDHTYTLYFRKSAGTTEYSAGIYYKYRDITMMAIGI